MQNIFVQGGHLRYIYGRLSYFSVKPTSLETKVLIVLLQETEDRNEDSFEDEFPIIFFLYFLGSLDDSFQFI